MKKTYPSQDKVARASCFEMKREKKGKMPQRVISTFNVFSAFSSEASKNIISSCATTNVPPSHHPPLLIPVNCNKTSRRK